MRARLRHAAARTAWALAENQERLGDVTGAAASARRAAELVTDDESALRQVLTLLDRVGDVSGAVTAYEAFAERLRRELDIAPSSATRQLVELIRARAIGAAAAGVPPSPAASVSSPAGARPVVAVRPFSNLTGDPALDYVGRLAASTIAAHLATARVADVEIVDHKPGTEPRPGDLIAEGSYHLADGRWQVTASLRDGGSPRLLGGIAPAAAPRERVWEATEAIARRTVGAIGAHIDPRVASWASAIGEPPSYEAHQAHVLGIELHLRGDYQEAIAHFLAAASTDAGFAVPLLWAIQASCNLEEFEQAAAIQAELASHRARLAPAERLVCDYYGAWLSADRGSALRLLRQAVDLVPDTELLVQLGRDALQLNRVKYAVEVLERVDPDAGWVPSWTPYWQRLTEAYHLLGEHRKELAAARRARAQHPEAMGPRLYEVRAAAALGDSAQVTKAVDDAIALGADRFGTAGQVLLSAAQELRVHGDAASASAMLDRAIRWQEDAAAGDTEGLTLARLYYERGEWARAAEVVDAGSPHPVDLAGWRGAIAARTSDTAGARAGIASLKAMTGAYLFGRQLVWASRIAAVLGDQDAARGFLSGALARGFPYGIDLHTDPDLALVADALRELLRLRD